MEEVLAADLAEEVAPVRCFSLQEYVANVAFFQVVEEGVAGDATSAARKATLAGSVLTGEVSNANFILV